MDKAADAFRTIGEVAEALETPAHVLRFWESRFTQVKPVKRAGGRRYYRPSDVALLSGIRKLLHDDGLTIRGVQKMLKEKGVRHVAGLSGVTAEEEAAVAPDSSDAMPAWRGAPAAPLVPNDAVQHPVDRDLFAASDEAPMMLDAVDPVRDSAHVALMTRAQTAAAPATETDVADEGQREPAAVLLRAMDAIRARDKHAELRNVYNRLTALRGRLARSEDAGGR